MVGKVHCPSWMVVMLLGDGQKSGKNHGVILTLKICVGNVRGNYVSSVYPIAISRGTEKYQNLKMMFQSLREPLQVFFFFFFFLFFFFSFSFFFLFFSFKNGVSISPKTFAGFLFFFFFFSFKMMFQSLREPLQVFSFSFSFFSKIILFKKIQCCCVDWVNLWNIYSQTLKKQNFLLITKR